MAPFFNTVMPIRAVRQPKPAANSNAVLVTDDAKATATTTHLIILAHGIDGAASDMHAVREAILGLHIAGVEVWETRANEGSFTHDGIFKCAERIWIELLPAIEERTASLQSPLRISFVGHSMGGLMLRAVSAILHASPQSQDVSLDTLVCIASPHLGCRLLGNGGGGGVAPLMSALGPSMMRAGLRLIKGSTGPDLLLDNDSLARLCDEAHCRALAAFRRRIVYTNGSGDWLVNVESASLLAASELDAVRPLSETACRAPGAGVVWRPAAASAPTEASSPPPLPPSLSIAHHHSATAGGDSSAAEEDTPDVAQPTTSLLPQAPTLRLHPLPSTWDEQETARAHTTWDDRSGYRGALAARLLWTLRALGTWDLHVCHFFHRSSFSGGVFAPHIDLIHLPGKVSQHYGKEVVSHLAANLLEQHDAAYV